MIDMELPDGRRVPVDARGLLNYAQYGYLAYEKSQAETEAPAATPQPQKPMTAEEKLEALTQEFAEFKQSLTQKEEISNLQMQLNTQAAQHEITKNDPEMANIVNTMVAAFQTVNPKVTVAQAYPQVIAVLQKKFKSNPVSNGKLNQFNNRTAPQGSSVPVTAVPKATPKDVKDGASRRVLTDFLKGSGIFGDRN